MLAAGIDGVPASARDAVLGTRRRARATARARCSTAPPCSAARGPRPAARRDGSARRARRPGARHRHPGAGRPPAPVPPRDRQTGGRGGCRATSGDRPAPRDPRRAGGHRRRGRRALAFHADGCGDAELVLEHARCCGGRLAAGISPRRGHPVRTRCPPLRRGRARDSGRLYDALADELRHGRPLGGCGGREDHLGRAVARAGRAAAGRRRPAQVRRRDVAPARGDEVARAFKEARRSSSRSGPTEELAWLYASARRGQHGGPPVLYDRSVEMARALDSPAVLAYALSGVGLVAACRARTTTSPCGRPSQIALTNGFQQEVGRSYANYTEYMHGDLRFDEAAPRPRRDPVLRRARRRDVRQLPARGLREGVRGPGAMGRSTARTRGRSSSPAASPINRLFSLVVAGVIAARRGRQDDADAFLAEAQQRLRRRRGAAYIAFTRVALAEAHWLRGDLDGARAHLAVARAR